MNKLSVGQRLTMLVGVPLVIIVLLVYSSLSSFSVINQGVGRIYDDRVIPLIQLKTINDAYAVGMIDAINKADNGLLLPDAALEGIRKAQKAIDENWSAYKDGNLNEQERALIEQTEEHFAGANEVIDEAAEILAGMGDTMSFDEDGETLITDYNGDLYEYIDPITTNITALINIQLEIAQQERTNAQEIYDSASTWFIIVAVAASIIMAGSGIWVGNSISGPLNRLRQAIEQASRDRNLTVRIDTSASDEIGRVATAFAAMMTQFRQILSEVRDSAGQLQEFVTSLAKSTEATRAGVKVQTRETDQVATASTEMTHAIEEVSRNAHQAAQAASDANTETEAGTKVLEQAIRSVNKLATRISKASEVINRVETDSAAIGSVLDVIRGIAEQTNLLALNAAIEAARAGEQGRGFAVVADEVRSLAQRTQESTQEIQQMIERLQNGSREAVRSMAEGSNDMGETVDQAEHAGKSLSAISTAVSMINDMNNQIASATEEQMATSQEISRNAVNISDAARSSENAVAQLDQATDELKQLATRLANKVKEFRTD